MALAGSKPSNTSLVSPPRRPREFPRLTKAKEANETDLQKTLPDHHPPTHLADMSQCVSCNNQPNDNDSLGGGTHEGAVTPMVVGIIAGTVVVFVLVLCALFYCAKLENDKARRSLKAADAEVDDNIPAAVETAGAGGGGGGGFCPPPRRVSPPPPPPADGDDEGVEMLDCDGEDGRGGRQHQHPGRPEELGAAKSRLGERRASSVTVVDGEVDDSRAGAGTGANSSWVPAAVVGGKKRGLFGWGGGGKKSSGRGECRPPSYMCQVKDEPY